MDDTLPSQPSFSEEEIRRCKETGDYKPVLFEWYKFVSGLGMTVTHILPESPCFRQVSSQHYNVLVGLLNRCSRLMLSNVAISHEGLFGETTAIIDRCIFESAVNLIWLCSQSKQEEFDSFIAKGLKTELEFRESIEKEISARGGEPFPFEIRMLKSIDNHIAASGLSRSEIKEAKKYLDIASIMGNLGYKRLFYIVFQKIGSHHIHGNWPSLLFHYLEERDENIHFRFKPRGHDCDTHINQYMAIPLLVLQAMACYVRFILEDDDAKVFLDLFDATEQKILRIYNEAGEDAR